MKEGYSQSWNPFSTIGGCLGVHNARKKNKTWKIINKANVDRMYRIMYIEIPNESLEKILLMIINLTRLLHISPHLSNHLYFHIQNIRNGSGI